ncbi:MAG: DUF6088 family protein [Bacteroidales bacterium]|nr:DUF6088 family protein [Bacteroidales bacterium]MDD4684392.1 DUF6088 family protein [Bacteroidales bacterium]
MSVSIFDTVRKLVLEKEMGEILFVSDFSHLNDDESVNKILSRLVHEGRLERISRGIYLKAKKTDFGSLIPSLDEIAHAIAKRDKVKIFPSGNTALNMLGLSTQVPMVAEYITTGSTRTVKVGKRKIVFSNSTPKNFEYKNELIHLIVVAMKKIGQKNISDEDIEVIQNLLSDRDSIENWKEDIQLAPVWIRKIIINLIENIEL